MIITQKIILDNNNLSDNNEQYREPTELTDLIRAFRNMVCVSNKSLWRKLEISLN